MIRTASRSCYLILILLSIQSAGDSLNIIAVVDSKQPQYESHLRAAVDYVNSPSIGILPNHNITLDVIVTMDNDSFDAMDQVCSRLPNGVALILDLTSRYVTMTIRSLAEAYGITHVSAVDPSHYDMESTEYNMSLNIVPPSSIIPYSIRDIVSQENLTNVGIIYDLSFDMDDKPKGLLRNVPAQHLYMRMGTTVEEILLQLEKIKTAELHHLFLLCSATNAERYLGQVNLKGMMSFKYIWYILTQDMRVACSQCEKVGTVVTLTGGSSNSKVLEYVDFMEERRLRQGLSQSFTGDSITMEAAFHFDLMKLVSHGLESLMEAGNWEEINHTHCYNFTGPEPAALQQGALLKESILQVNYSGVFGSIEWSDGRGEQQTAVEVKRLTFENGAMTSETLIGNWTRRGHLYAFQGTIADTNVKKQYRIVMPLEPPFIFKSEERPENVEHVYHQVSNGTYYYGYCIDLLTQISQKMGFEYTLYEPPDNAYGTMQADGSWNGLVRELIDDRADIAVAPLSVMAERENVIDFTVPYYDLVGITILMKKPKFEYSVFRFMSVLEETVWGCVFSAFIIVSILLTVFDKYSPYSYQNNKDSWDGQGEEPRVFTLKEGLWFCMTSLTPQGGGEAPRALSGRLVAATWWMFGFIMIATYTANLAAFLTVSRLEQPIESLDDLANQFKTKYAPQESTSTETYFRRMSDIEEKFYTIWKQMSLNDSLDEVERAKLAVWDYPVSDKFTNMWAAMKDSGFPKTFQEAIDRIKNPPNEKEEFAYIGDATQNKYATLTDCELWEVGEEFSRKPYALAVQEGSPLKNELSSVILQLLNQRVLEDLKSFWWEFNKTKCDKIEDESDGISIQNIGGVFLVIFIGIGLGLITLAFEYYWYKWRPAIAHKHSAKEAHVNSAYDTAS